MGDYRLLSVDLNFEPFVYEHDVLIPASNRRYLEDVGIVLRGRPHFVHSSARGSPHDVKLYLDGIDITKEYLEELRLAIAGEDQAKLRRQYRDALQEWLKLARKLGLAYGTDIPKEEREAERLANVEPFSKLIDSLGNHSAGYAGFLHIFNFLHVDVKVPAISFHKVVDRAIAAGKPLDRLTIRRLTISNGPCRLFTQNWEVPTLFGGVLLEADFRYHDPIEDRIRDLETRVTELERTLNEDLALILERVSADGPIFRELASARAAIGSASVSLNSLKSEVGSQATQLNGLSSAARDLKNAVDAL